jgi:hypothetical protein
LRATLTSPVDAPSRSQRPRRRRPALRALAAATAAVLGLLALPSDALAHAETGVQYDFPLPIWLFVVAGAAAVVASVPAAVLARPRPDRVSADLLPRLPHLPLLPIAQAVCALLLVEAILAGIFGAPEFNENPATLLFWVVFWVGLGVVSTFVGNLWELVSPLGAAGRWIDRDLGERAVAGRGYPRRLGMWPAVALVLALAWLELCWPAGQEPDVLALILLTYALAQIYACAVFGAGVWLVRGELFTAVARTFARFAPFELYVRPYDGPCTAALRHTSDERLGCVSCWRAAPPGARGLRLRPFASGVHREGDLGPGGGAFVVALLATIVFDGFRGTGRYLDLTEWLLERVPWFVHHATTLRTLVMAGIVAAFVGVYVAAAAAVGRLERRDPLTVAGRYAPTLIPIAAVYFTAHYLTYLLLAGQFAPGAVVDPLGRDWVPDYVWVSELPGALVWALQLALIVWGHVAAVFQAHRLAREDERGRVATVVAHAPLTALMVAYTAIGLWVLAQAIEATG